jgi:hypothetical protein
MSNEEVAMSNERGLMRSLDAGWAFFIAHYSLLTAHLCSAFASLREEMGMIFVCGRAVFRRKIGRAMTLSAKSYLRRVK